MSSFHEPPQPRTESMRVIRPPPPVAEYDTVARCRDCHQVHACLPPRLDAATVTKLESIIRRHRHLRGGAYLYRTGTRFASLFMIRGGCLKTVLTRPDGRFQVIGLYLPGDVVGFDGLASGQHTCDAVSLECDACQLPFASLQELASAEPQLQRHIHRLMSTEVVRQYGIMLLLGNLHADERIAVFLQDLSQRHEALGFSPRRFELRMSRADIGSYLGLTLETVSRILSRFRRAGMITVEGRAIEIVDLDRLGRVIGAREGPESGGSCASRDPGHKARPLPLEGEFAIAAAPPNSVGAAQPIPCVA